MISASSGAESTRAASTRWPIPRALRDASEGRLTGTYPCRARDSTSSLLRSSAKGRGGNSSPAKSPTAILRTRRLTPCPTALQPKHFHGDKEANKREPQQSDGFAFSRIRTRVIPPTDTNRRSSGDRATISTPSRTSDDPHAKARQRADRTRDQQQGAGGRPGGRGPLCGEGDHFVLGDARSPNSASSRRRRDTSVRSSATSASYSLLATGLCPKLRNTASPLARGYVVVLPGVPVALVRRRRDARASKRQSTPGTPARGPKFSRRRPRERRVRCARRMTQKEERVAGSGSRGRRRRRLGGQPKAMLQPRDGSSSSTRLAASASIWFSGCGSRRTRTG